VDLIAASGGKWVFIGMESIDPANLADVKKGFNKPGEYTAVLERLAHRNVYAITSFIFGMDNDTPGVAERTLQEIRTWPPGLPIFGLLTPLPATPLYKRLGAVDAAETLAGVHTFCDGSYAAEDDDRGSSCRGEIRVGQFVQSRGDCKGGRFARSPALGLSRQHLYRANVFSRNLLPSNGALGMGEGRYPESADNSQVRESSVWCLVPPAAEEWRKL
jgi:hypothetical protein